MARLTLVVSTIVNDHLSTGVYVGVLTLISKVTLIYSNVRVILII